MGSGIWGKILAGGAALLAILGGLLWVFKRGESSGDRKRQEKDRRNLEEAKDEKRKIQTDSAGLDDGELRQRLRDQKRHLP